MSFTSSMMYISPALLLILYGHIGFSDASPRISPYNASPRTTRKLGSASDTWGTFHTDTPRFSPESSSSVLGPVIVTPDSTSTKTAPTFQPPTTDPTTSTIPDAGVIISAARKERMTAPSSRLMAPRKRSADGPVLAPEKMLQTMMVSSMVSQRTANDAWAADATSGTSVEQQGEESPVRRKIMLRCVKIVLLASLLLTQSFWGKQGA